MTNNKVLKKLHELETKKTIYDIHWCNAGVGIIFYTGPFPVPDDWRRWLSVVKYYSTFEEAVNTEHGKLGVKP